jgi:hypothetical protein|nr:hypothetical protein [Neorhizobium tomejilense]
MKTALALASLLALATPAAASPLALSDSPYDQARSVVNVVFANYMAGLTGVSVQSAVVDLDGDKNGEIVARFVHSSACRAGSKVCRTVVIRHMGGDWKIVLDRFSDSIEVGEGYRDVPAALKVDGKTWDWDGKRYVPEVSELGDELTLKEVAAASRPTLGKAFGSPEKLEAAGQKISFTYTQDGLSKNKDLMLVKMEGDTVCGEFNGCPVRVLKKDGNVWKPVMSSATTGKVIVTKTSRQGYKDIVLETKDGALQMGWTGSAYAVADRIEGASK